MGSRSSRWQLGLQAGVTGERAHNQWWRRVGASRARTLTGTRSSGELRHRARSPEEGARVDAKDGGPVAACGGGLGRRAPAGAAGGRRAPARGGAPAGGEAPGTGGAKP
jgi:hypothetical protein